MFGMCPQVAGAGMKVNCCYHQTGLFMLVMVQIALSAAELVCQLCHHYSTVVVVIYSLI